VRIVPKRSPHRKKRSRRPLPGMMLFRAGSTCVWSADQPPLDLIVALDEAGSEIYSALPIEEEGAALRFRAGRSNERVIVLLLH
jgi:hypothetical protein